MPAPAEDVALLFRHYRATGDSAVRERLVLLYENLARYLATRFLNRGEPLEDLIQVAVLGLIKAIDRFDPDRGARFTTFAMPTIVGEIKRHFRDRGWHVKVPRRLHELNQRVIKANEQLAFQLGRPPTITEIAASVGATEAEALDAMELGGCIEPVSLETPVPYLGDDLPLCYSDILGADDRRFQEIDLRDELRAAVERLEDRERRVIALRFYEAMSQSEMAEHLDVSQMQVSRLLQSALKHLREAITDFSADEAVADLMPASPAQ